MAIIEELEVNLLGFLVCTDVSCYACECPNQMGRYASLECQIRSHSIRTSPMYSFIRTKFTVWGVSYPKFATE